MNQNTLICPFFGYNYMVVGNEEQVNNRWCILIAFVKYMLSSFCYLIKNNFCDAVGYIILLLITSIGLSVFIFFIIFIIINIYAVLAVFDIYHYFPECKNESNVAFCFQFLLTYDDVFKMTLYVTFIITFIWLLVLTYYKYANRIINMTRRNIPTVQPINIV